MSESSIKTQWQKRVEITQFFYMTLILDLSQKEINQMALDFDFDAHQIQMINYFSLQKDIIVKNIQDYLKQNWTWKRLPIVTQAILMVAYCEYSLKFVTKPIAIDQALITANRYGQLDQKGFINALLEKILK